jgi:hypothetical protein
MNARCQAVIGAIAVAVSCGSGVCQEAFVFDNGFYPRNNTNLAFNGDGHGGYGYRAWATVDPSGNPSCENQARYWNRPLLLCGAPAERSDISTTYPPHGAMQLAFSGGFDSDGLHRLTLVVQDTAGYIDIYRDDIGAPTPELVSHKYTGTTGIKQGVGDIMIYEGSANGEQDRFVYEPTGFIVCYGLVVAICTYREYIGDGYTQFGRDYWKPRSTAVCYWRHTPDVGTALGWRIAGVLGDTQVEKERGNYWQVEDLWVAPSQGAPTTAYLTASDYVGNNSTWNHNTYYSSGGIVLICKLERTDPSDPMAITQGPVKLVELGSNDGCDGAPNGPPGFHIHSAHFEPLGSAGARVVIPLGDWTTNNRVMTRTIASRDNAMIPSDWSVHDDVNGNHWDCASSTPVGDGNQYVAASSLGPYGTGGMLMGGDESAVCIAKLAPGNPNNTGEKVNFTRVFGTGTASTRDQTRKLFNTFAIANWENQGTGPYAAVAAASSEWSDASDAWTKSRVTKILYSPNGQDFGICWAVNDTDEPVAWYADASGNKRICFGSSGRTDVGAQGHGTRSIPEPAHLSRQPLCIGTGGTNRLRAQVNFDPSTVQAPNSVELVAPSALSAYGASLPPPCSGEVYRCRRDPAAVGDTDLQMGIWQLTNDNVPSGQLKARIWVYPIPWGTSLPNNTAEDVAASLSPGIDFGPYNSMSTVSALTVDTIVTVGDSIGGWYPVTLDTSTSWTSALGMRVRNRPIWFTINNQHIASPADFLMALDYVELSTNPIEHAGVSLPPESSSLSTESAVISGFSCGENWTISLAGMIPIDSWDCTDTVRPDPVAPICTLWESPTKYIEISLLTGMAANTNQLQFSFTDGASNTLRTLTFDAFTLRQSPVLFGLSHQAVGSYASAASLSGSIVFASDGAWDSGLPQVYPTEIRFSDAAMARTTPMMWFGGRVNVNAGDTASAMGSSLCTLSFLSDVNRCGYADFNCDGDVGTDEDIQAFWHCLAGDCPPCPCSSTSDFNGDGDPGTDADMEAFFRVLAGNAC